MIDTNTPYSVNPLPESPATPETPTPEIPAPVKSKGGRPRKHASPANRVAAHRIAKKQGTTQKQMAAAEKAEAAFDKKHPSAPTEQPPEHPMRTGKTPADDKAFEAAMVIYRKKLAAFEKLWADWLDADCDPDSPTNTHIDRGSVMKWAPSRTKGRLVTGEMDLAQLTLIQAAGARQAGGKMHPFEGFDQHVNPEDVGPGCGHEGCGDGCGYDEQYHEDVTEED